LAGLQKISLRVFETARLMEMQRTSAQDNHLQIAAGL
jgi:hypothetical protein